MENGPPEEKDPYRFVYRSAWEDVPDTPRTDVIWAESYQEALDLAYGTMDVMVVAVYPVEEEERLREALVSDSS